MAKVNQPIKDLLYLIIKIYRYVMSPFLGECCRFYPSCSVYFQQALQEYGLITALWLTLKRLARCHPGCEGGYDPLP